MSESDLICDCGHSRVEHIEDRPWACTLCDDNSCHGFSLKDSQQFHVGEQPAQGEPRPTDEWAEALSVEIQQCITRDGEEDPRGSIAEILVKRVIPIVKAAASPSDMSAEQWMQQTGEYATELCADVGMDTYKSILATMQEFAEAYAAQQNRELREERDARDKLLHTIVLAVCDPREAVKGNVPSQHKAVELIIDGYLASAKLREERNSMDDDLEQVWTALGMADYEGEDSAATFVARVVKELGHIREERDALKREIFEWECKKTEWARAESALLELLGVMYGWAKYGEESDPWYYSEEQAPGWKADSERVSKLIGFKLKAKP